MKLLALMSFLILNTTHGAMTTVELSRICNEEITREGSSECYRTCRTFILNQDNTPISLCVRQFFPERMSEQDQQIVTACNHFGEEANKKRFCFESCSRISQINNSNFENELNECVQRVERTFTAQPPSANTVFQWAEDAQHRKIISSRSCGRRICVGNVSYTDSNGIIRTQQAVCNANKCGENDATACARQASYGIATYTDFNQPTTPASSATPEGVRQQ